MIVGFCGRKFSGKDTCASILKDTLAEYYNEVITIAFADGIKEQLSTIFDIPIECFHDQNLKEVCLDQYPYRTPRNLMLWYGTMMKNEFGDNFWVEYAKRKLGKIDPHKAYIFTDVRFVQEATMIKEMGGTICYVDRDKFLPDMRSDAHISERSVYEVKEKFDVRVIDNNKNLDYLQLHVPFICGVHSHCVFDWSRYNAAVNIQNCWRKYKFAYDT